MLPVNPRWRDDPSKEDLVDLCEDFYLTTEEVARRWRITEQHLYNLRRLGQGPEFVKLFMGSVRYRASVIIKYERAGFVKTKPVDIGGKRRGRRV